MAFFYLLSGVTLSFLGQPDRLHRRPESKQKKDKKQMGKKIELKRFDQKKNVEIDLAGYLLWWV
jgi:hypothetical protein